MKIGYYTPNYPGLTSDGGIGTYTRTLAHDLAALGHTVHVLTPGNLPTTSEGPVRVHFTRTDDLPAVDSLLPGVGACWRVGWAVRRLVKECGLDLVEFPNWEGHGLLLPGMTCTPMVVRLSTSSKESQEIDGTPSTRWHRWDVRRERWQARLAAILVTHSDAHRQLMAEEVGVPAERIQVIPLGIPVFPDYVRPPSCPGAKTVVYLGRLEKRKGTLDLIRAVPLVLRSAPDTRFVFIGADRRHCPGDRTHAEFIEQELPAEARRQIQLLGRLPDAEVDRWLQLADVFVAPSLYESFGLIFPEAMRWGTPVVGTRVGGIPEIVQHNETGLLVAPGSPEELAGAITTLLLNPELRRVIGEAGRRRVETEFSVARMAERTGELYARVLEMGRVRRRRAS